MFDDLFNNDCFFDNVSGLTDELKCLYVDNYSKKTSSNIVLVTSTLYEANKLYQTLYNYNNKVVFFPMDDFLTSEALAISPELKITRLETLSSLVNKKATIVVTNLMGYLRYLVPSKTFKSSSIVLNSNTDYLISQIELKLFDLGYEKETIVNRTGQYAVRGFVIDVFPIDEINPVRIEFWGDTIESIRTFDVDTQLTIKKIDRISIIPNSEFIVNKDVVEKKQKDLPLYSDVVNINEYLNNPTVIFNEYDTILVNYKLLLDEISSYNKSIGVDNTKYMNDFDKCLYKNSITLYGLSDSLINVKNTQKYKSYQLEPFNGDSSVINKRLNSYLKQHKKIVICLSNRYQVNKLIDYLDNDNIVFTTEDNIVDDKINVIVKIIKEGFVFKNYIVISESELFNKKSSNNYKTKFRLGKKIRDITKLNTGDYVVHMTYGIGVYGGIKTLVKNGLKKDYLLIQYRDKDKLYIPVEKIELISKYASSDGIVPKINKLGGTEWEKTKLRVKNKVEDIALELLDLYAKRESSKGFSFDKDNDLQVSFEKEFIYEETVDQLRVTEEIKNDMESSSPMDRLLCGDVGYGKTEVAFRAMFKAVLSGKQVAMLCPTTILSSQHYNNAIERFKSFPIRIALLNRFVSPIKISQTIKDIKDKKIDIVIGTHRVLSNDIEFKDLGLLVIDEEQRFGVRHKEKIKEFKNNIDVLTLSATPIPRTLQLSLAGLRNLSLIETPPINRYPVETYVLALNKEIIKDAINKELSRNGQAFILYNHIDDMDSKVNEISKIVPDAKILSIHGRMDKNKIENIMIQFNNHEFDVLICTTIIETGIDIPNVNTLIIMDADRFGLSQLYQIRGRVGRGERIAYCYLMYQPGKILSDVATKRLNVIKEFTELGSGFSIAMRDLSIRGAGSILGSQQAGFIDTIGVELFMKMLSDEVNRLKGITVNNQETKEPLLEVETTISDNYVKEEELKIEIHKKINSIDSYDMLVKVKEELEDRFGKISENLLIYMYEEWFEKLISNVKIEKINQTKNFVEIILDKELSSKLDGELLFMKTNEISRMFRFSMKNDRLIITLDTIKLEKHFIYYLIELVEIIKEVSN